MGMPSSSWLRLAPSVFLGFLFIMASMATNNRMGMIDDSFMLVVR